MLQRGSQGSRNQSYWRQYFIFNIALQQYGVNVMGVSDRYRQHRLKILCMKGMSNALWQEDWNQTSLTLLVTSLHSHQYALSVALNGSLFAGSGKLYDHHHLMSFLSNLTIKGIGRTEKVNLLVSCICLPEMPLVVIYRTEWNCKLSH